MPVNLSIKNTPEKIVRKLKHTEAAERRQPITLTELVARGRRRGLSSSSEVSAIVRVDRDSR